MRAFRGALLHCLRDPGEHSDADAIEYFDDGILLVDDGYIVATGAAASLLPTLGDDVEQIDLSDRLIVPGFIDCHIHYPQTDVVAAYGTQLLDWLNTYTFPAEAAFADAALAAQTAEFFVDQLLANGTTTALVFATVHPGSVDALFTVAQRYNLRLAAGKVLMDRHCPENLRDTAQSGYDDSRALIERWHKTDRLHYAITPRFAVTSSPEQLDLAGRLAAEYPDTLIHTHVAENHDEVRWVGELFPEARSYLGVYADAGLMRERAVFAHGIHLDDTDHQCLASHDAALAFCPTSNLFLGSGLFDYRRTREAGVRVGLGTDIGGGTSFSQLRSVSEAYKILQLQQQSLPAMRGLYLATLAGAEALHMDDKLGNFLPGKEADFVALDLQSTPLLARRMRVAKSVDDALFANLILADERAIVSTWVMGECCYECAPAR
ncbi:MAG: guanine deaminase [Pseudomonadota bacterium]